MLNNRQLYQHLQYILHAPVRLFEADGGLVPLGGSEENQEDPLLCDSAFTAQLLSLRKDTVPVLYGEARGALYAVVPAENAQTLVMGPVCYAGNPGTVSRSVAVTHHLTHPNSYYIPYVPLGLSLECVIMLFHAYSDAPLSRDQLLLQSTQMADFTEEAEAGAYSITYSLRESNSSHNSYAQETREQKAIREGNLTALKESWEEAQIGEIGLLGRDELSHYRNYAIVVITLACRSAIEGGVLPEIAYSLADHYTAKTGDLDNPAALVKLCRSAEIHFAELVRESSRNNSPQSRYVLRCKELVHNRLHQKVTVTELAAELGLSRTYLSQIFFRETGVKISDYILTEKIRASEYLLTRPEYSLEQIAATFGFASQSHYGQVFRKLNGITPSKYRELHQKWK